MGWAREQIDRWRRGPVLRASQALVQELERQIKQATKENLKGAHAYVDLTQQRDLLLAFVTSGHVKARCRAAGCGDLTFDFALHRVTIGDDRVALVAICGPCGRRLKREEEKAQVAATAATPATEAVPPVAPVEAGG